MTKPTITIVGLGLIGASLGMALRRAEVASAVVGHDKEMAVANQARKREAVDKVEWNVDLPDSLFKMPEPAPAPAAPTPAPTPTPAPQP